MLGILKSPSDYKKNSLKVIFSNIFKCCFSLEVIVCCLRENVFYAYFPNVLLDLAAALAAMVLVDSNKEVVGATGHISTRPVPR